MKPITYQEVLYRAAEAAGRTRSSLPVSEALILKSVFNLELDKCWGAAEWNELIPNPLAVAVVNGEFSKSYQDTTSITVSGAGIADANGAYTYNSTTGLYERTGTDGSYTINAAFTQLVNVNNPNYSPGVLYFASSGEVTGPWSTDEFGTDPAPTVAYTNAVVELGDILGIFTANPRTTTVFDELEWDEGNDIVRVTPLDGYTSVPATVYVEYQLPTPDLLAIAAGSLNTYELPFVLGAYLAHRGAAHLLTSDGQTGLAGVQFGLAKDYLDDQMAKITRPRYRQRIRMHR